MEQNLILSKLRNGHSRISIGTEIAMAEGIGLREAMEQVHGSARVLVEGISAVERSEMLAELIETTKAVQHRAMENDNYSVALGAINTLAKLTGLLS